MTALSPPVPKSLSGPSLVAGLSPVVAAVFLGFLAVGIPLGALPLEVHGGLGFGPATVGWVVGLQSLATLLTRHQSGTLCDRRGPRQAILLGLPVAAVAGLLYALADIGSVGLSTRLAILLAGRVLMGLGESLFLTGLMNLGLARLGAGRTGLVMSWTGIAIYAALGLGAPLGLALQAAFGFAGVGLVTAAMPVLAFGIALRLPSVPAAGGGTRVPFHRVMGLIWRPGLVLSLATVPFATMTAFLALDYAAHGWPRAGTALFGFGAAYVVVRLVASGLPDRIGATRVAVGSLALETLGQAVLWGAPGPAGAVLGATLTGLGFSLVFPAMGVLATRSVPADQRGRAVGNFIAFADIALAATGPVMGLLTQQAPVSTAFLAGAVATLAGLGLVPSIRPRAAA